MITNDISFNRMARALLMDYIRIYYVNVRTEEFRWYSFDEEFHSLRIEMEGEDFFQTFATYIQKLVVEEDRHVFEDALDKVSMLNLLNNNELHSFQYRLMMEERPVWHSMRVIQETVEGEDYLIIGVQNIDEEVQEDRAAEKMKQERQVFNQIAASLAKRYDLIYYVDIVSGVYTEFLAGDIYGDTEIQQEGNDFFAESVRNSELIVHPEDKERVLSFLDKDYLISRLDEQKQFSTEYRLMIDGRPQQTRLTVIWSEDKRHFIICVESIEEEVRKEQEQLRALQEANALARRDELTGIKNKNAYTEFMRAVQREMDKEGKYPPFACAAFDLNNLKEINDTRGHAMGDEYLVRAARMICKVFQHSPVFRIGGDEFAAILMQHDYECRDMLYERFRQQVQEHMKLQDGPVVAIGMAVYDAQIHETIAAVMEEADQKMYENKRRLKEGIVEEDEDGKAIDRIIPESRRRALDQMFEAFSMVAEGTGVYICDMRHDYSRWSKSLVDEFGVPAEYMFDAGYIWEDHIHAEDRDAYHDAMDEIFFGGGTHHDMQYRARNSEGEYVVCTCRGAVIRDRNGDAEYFCGTIRDHGMQDDIDSITGLRNQYAFLEDLQRNLENRKTMQVWVVGISRFSELNDVYGYQFGNLLLQKFARYLFEHVGNTGMVYRLDGTKFGVISSSSTEELIQERYVDLRAHFRDGFYVDEHYIILELNAGLLAVDNFEIDERTAFACVNYAYSESKNHCQGDLVRFENKRNEENQEWIEKIQAIRASITQRYKGYFLVYQPVVDAHSGRLVGAEALIRWRGEPYGLVPPNEFVEVLERDSLFPGLGRWILQKALRDTKTLLKEYPDFVIDVNLAYTQLERDGFTDEVIQILRNADFPPGNLCLEITERCKLLDLDLLNNVVEKLHSIGVQVALDDFGTGFSSIGIVKNLPLDCIKIDRCLVKDIEEDVRGRQLIKDITSAATTYGANVCVEGVENEAMERLLREYPVRSFQGFYYSKPLEFEELKKWIRRQQTQTKEE